MVQSIDRRTLLAAAGLAAVGGLACLRGLAVPARLRPSAYDHPSQIFGVHFPFEIVDATGARQWIAAPAQRILALSYPQSEILMLLVDQRRVVAVPQGTDDARINNAAGFYAGRVVRHHSRLEEFIALQPDLFLAGDNTPASTVEVLIASGITVLRFAYYDSFAEVDRNVRLLARLLDAGERGRAVLTDMWSRLAAVRSAVQGAYRPRLIWYGQSGGVGTLNDEMIEFAGARNVVRNLTDLAATRLPEELAISLQPEVIIFGEWTTGKLDMAYVKQSPSWRDVPAVRNGRLYLINSAWGTTGSPFRVRGIEQLARILHPERFAA